MTIAIIGGSGLDRLERLGIKASYRRPTAYGAPSAPIVRGDIDGVEVLFLARHGSDHHLPPHLINYRANIAALAALGASEIIATTAVGGISAQASPGTIVIPHQIIDYTYGREQTLYDGTSTSLNHIDFTSPYSARLRDDLIATADRVDGAILGDGVYGATQGPRLETAAEIKRLARDGCTIVGMTGMPEAALAREAGLDYASCSLVVNWGAGIGPTPITMAAIEKQLATGMTRLMDMVVEFLKTRR